MLLLQRFNKTVMWMVLVGGGAVCGLAAEDIIETRLNESIRIFNEKALSIDEPLMATHAVEAMLKTVDPKGGVYSETEFEDVLDTMRGRHFAAGLQLSFTGRTPVVSGVLQDSPAAAAGVQVKDHLIRVNDQSLEGLTPPEIISLLRADDEVSVALQFDRAEDLVDTEFILTPIQLPTIEAVEYFPEGIVYVMANGIFDGGGAELLELLQKFKQENRFGVILDLRGANGMDIESVNQVADLFAAPDTMLYRYQDKNGTTISEYRSDNNDVLGLPLMLLIDQSTGGASELLATIGKHSLKGCMILGSQSSGTPLLREAIPLSNGMNMFMATRRLVSGPKQVSYDGTIGLKPDIKVSNNWSDASYEPEFTVTTLEEEKEDKALRDRLRGDGPLSRATDLLLGLKALNIQSAKKTGDE